MAPAIDWNEYDQLKAQGLADREIARRWGISWETFHREKQKRGGLTERVSVQPPGVSERTPVVSKGVSQGVPVEVLPSVPVASGGPEMTPLLQEILQELHTLTRGLAGRVSERVFQRVSLGPRKKTERWNLHLPQDIVAQTKARA